jgi:ferric-dicitrate binding protein FerR (iron transport regulator)
METQRIVYLLERYVAVLLTEAEEQELAVIMNDPRQEELVRSVLLRLLEDEPAREQPGSGYSAGAALEPAGQPTGAATNWDAVLQRVFSVDKTKDAAPAPIKSLSRLRNLPSLRSLPRRWIAAAAVLILLGGSALYIFTRSSSIPPVAKTSLKSTDPIHPGSNRAILTLANGQQIVLDDAHNGVLGQQGKTQVIKLDSGRLAYNSGGNGKSNGGNGKSNDADGKGADAPLYNTITTPRGGQYQITLPDETKVWLNAESSLRFPTAFTATGRMVELTGEAYFEVAPNKSKPFLVKSGQSNTRVLGTSFNIMAYPDEGPVRTTLLEGAVKIDQGGHSAVLEPGEQGIFNDGVISTKTVNIRAVVAWKDGYYFFDRTPVQSVMRQIARWYNVDIVYPGAVPKDEIVGRIPRTAYVSDVLHIMELIGIHFKIEGRTIFVTPE